MKGLGYVEVIGDIELFAKLNNLAGPTALKCARQGIMAGLVPLGKAIRQQVNATTLPPSKKKMAGKRSGKQEKQGQADIKRAVR